MLSVDIANLGGLVRDDDRLPKAARAILHSFLEDFAERARAMETGGVPLCCVDLRHERLRRARPAGAA